MDGDASGKYDGLTRPQLVALLEKRDRARKLGLGLVEVQGSRLRSCVV